MKHTAAEKRRIREALDKAMPHLLDGLLYLPPDALQAVRRRLGTAFRRGYNTAMNDLLRGSRQ